MGPMQTILRKQLVTKSANDGVGDEVVTVIMKKKTPFVAQKKTNKEQEEVVVILHSCHDDDDIESQRRVARRMNRTAVGWIDFFRVSLRIPGSLE
jgi:hypothetical protein